MINPFYMKDLVVWKREMPFGKIRGTRLAVLGAMALPAALVALLWGFDLVDAVPVAAFDHIHISVTAAGAAWVLSAVTWFTVMSVLAINAGIQVYPRERDLGTLDVAALTPTSPWKEVVGRYRGAFIPIFEGWLMGALYVATSLIIPIRFDNLCCAEFYPIMSVCNIVAAVWLPTLMWCALLTAVSLYWSTQTTTTSGAFGAVLTTVLVVNLYYAAVSASLSPKSAVLPCEGSGPALLAMPLNPGVVGMLVGREAYFFDVAAPHWPAWTLLLVAVAPLWIAATCLVLYGASGAVTAQAPLRRRRSPQGATGLVPSTSTTPLSPPTGRRPAEPLDHGLSTRLLEHFEGNPFYHAYRKGFLRSYVGESAAPGTVMAAAVMTVGLVKYRLLTVFDSPVGIGVLLISLTIASVIGACEGFFLGARALSTERDQSTWPMLVVSGMRPATLLRGKFATAFYALSGEWSIATPLWGLAALSWHPFVALLALVQPAAITLGILFGLWTASQPRYLHISLQSTGLWTCGLLGGVWVIREVVLPNPGDFTIFTQAYNPLQMVNNLAGASTPD